MNYALFSIGVIAGFAFLPFILLSLPETATEDGTMLARMEYAGQGVAALAFGSLGLLYRKERFAAFVVLTSFAILAMMIA